MSGFSPAWLALREPADHDARSEELVRWAVGADPLSGRPRKIVDLATGTGSNPRYLMPRIGGAQDWTLFDGDRLVLDALPARMAAWATRHGWPVVSTHDGVSAFTLPNGVCRVTACEADLAVTALPELTFVPDLVTASALLDLVSRTWVHSLVDACRAAGAAALFVLSYDGRLTCTPEDPLDEQLREWVNAHQRTDKGFGPALGPDATTAAAEAFERAGYDVERRRSDWVLSAAHTALVTELINGWASAAAEYAPRHQQAVEGWRVRRVAEAGRGELRVTVGHEDLAARLASPPGRD